MTLDAFLDVFAAQARDREEAWEIQSGALRLAGTAICPVRFVSGGELFADHRTGTPVLGLSEEDFRAIVVSADGSTASASYSADVRQRLLAAARIDMQQP